jgi:hypothetical protein
VVLWCHLLERLLHGECNLLDGMRLRDRMVLSDGQSSDLLLESRLVLDNLIKRRRDALVDGCHELDGAVGHALASAEGTRRFGAWARRLHRRNHGAICRAIVVVPVL